METLLGSSPVELRFLFNYLFFIGTGILLLSAFVAFYVRFTPYHEFELVQKGNDAAALSLSGAALGFSLSIVSAILHNANWTHFVLWSLAACFVQVLTFVLLGWVVKALPRQIEEGNTAVGGLVGAAALCTGAINAACLS